MGQIDEAAWSHAVSFAQQDMAEVLGGDQHTIGLEAIDFGSQYGNVAHEAPDLDNGEAVPLYHIASGAVVCQGRADNAACMTTADERVQPDQIAARGSALGRRIRRVGNEEDAHGG